MWTDQIMYCIVALIIGMLLANMLKSVCGCKVVEGNSCGGEFTDDYCNYMNNPWDVTAGEARHGATGGSGTRCKVNCFEDAVSDLNSAAPRITRLSHPTAFLNNCFTNTCPWVSTAARDDQVSSILADLGSSFPGLH